MKPVTKQRTRALWSVFAALALAAGGCSKKVAGTWRGACAVERTSGGAPGEPGAPVPIEVTVTPAGDRYMMSVSMGTTRCAWTGAQGASTRQTERGNTELAFPAMPCTSVEGNSAGGNGHFVLLSTSEGGRLTGGADTRGTQLRIDGECRLAQ